MSMYDYVDTQLERVRSYARELVYGVVRFTKVTNATANGQGEKVAGHQGGDDNQVRRFSTWGIRSVPPAGVDCIIVRPGGGATNGANVGCESREYGPADLVAGEVSLYNKVTGCVIRCWEDGTISIDTPAGKVVEIQGGDQPVARKTDTLSASAAMAAWALVVETAIEALVPGTFTVPNQFAGSAVGNPGKADNFGSITTGSAKASCG